MIFILYAHTNAETHDGCRGLPQHNAAFVRDRFLSVLQGLGQVVVVSNPETQVDVIYDGCRERGEACVFLSFALPHQSAVGLRCPTLCVFAWEYDRIPDEVWDGERKNDWRYVLAEHGRAITHSQFAADVVRKQMGPDFPVAVLPIPLADASDVSSCAPSASPPGGRVTIAVSGVVIDSHNCRMTPDTMEWIEPAQSFHIEPWRGETIRMRFTEADECIAYLDGFYDPESWGTWSRTADPGIVLPYAFKGNVSLRLQAMGYGRNIGREVGVSLGGQQGVVRLREHFAETCIQFQSVQTDNIIKFSGLDVTVIPGAYDCRTMGIGLFDLEITGDPGPGVPEDRQQQAVPAREITLDGIVFTSVCDPLDDRKNWQDMVTAFCTAFQEVADATLVLQIPHPALSPFLKKLYSLLQRLSPFGCRVVAVHGSLDTAEYEKVRRVAQFYVNASRCEGASVDLVEHVARGKPVIAPCHTALADHVDASFALVVDSCLEPCVWPHDPRKVFRALRHRINWESLVAAYRRSYDLAHREPATYGAMAESARVHATRTAARAVVKEKLHAFFAAELGRPSFD